MGISTSLYTAVSGLTSNSDSLSVTANNIANANAVAFKKDRTEFEDILSISLPGGDGIYKIGGGSRLANIRTMHTQGGLWVTDKITDVAIQGDGFLVVSPPNMTAESTNGRFYTRVGTLQFDKDGYLSTSAGSRVQGYLADNLGNLSSKLTDVRLTSNKVPPRATSNLLMNVQLDSRSQVIEDDFNIESPEKTSNFNTSSIVFDSHGRGHQVVTYFRKTSSDEEGSQWQWHSTIDGGEIVDGEKGVDTQIATGRISFDKNGLLSEDEMEDPAKVSFSNGAYPDQEIFYDFGQNVTSERGSGAGASTAIGADSALVFHKQDGYEFGLIKNLKIENDGKVKGIYTNGVELTLGAITIATFANEAGLEKDGKNLFRSTVDSGAANIGAPGSGDRGYLVSSTLEESNVDIASEFINMIKTQRFFQANSKSITTSDRLLEEIINLKR